MAALFQRVGAYHEVGKNPTGAAVPLLPPAGGVVLVREK